MRHEGLDSEYTVTSSSGYSNSSEVKVGMSEVQRFPGIGFARVLHLPSVVSRVFQTEVTIWVSRMHRKWRMCTGMIPSTSMKLREMEVQSLYSLEVCGMCETELAYRRSRGE